MEGHLLQNRIVLLELETARSVLTILGGDVTRHAGHTAVLVFSALQNNLDAITFCFLCHCYSGILERYDGDVLEVEIALGCSALESGVEADFVDGAESVCADAELNPHILLHPVELLGVEVYVEFAFGATFRVRDVVAHRRLFAGDLTNF